MSAAAGLSLMAVSILGAGYSAYRREPEAATVSAPGKALIAGGYLVLEQPNVGVVVSCTSRFFTTIKACGVEELGEAGEEDEEAGDSKNSLLDTLGHNELLIVVFSPQFYTRFCFVFNIKSNELRQVEGSPNEFVQTCLQMVLSFARKQRGSVPFGKTMSKLISTEKFLGIKLRADNDFYSQTKVLQERGLPLTSKALSSLPSFIECPIDPETGELNVSKTGMGSSAALTTSLVGAWLKYFKIAHLGGQRPGLLGLVEFGLHSLSYILRGEGHNTSGTSSDEEKRIVHNLAQVCHSVAQGKIGSGFDVAAAVYGTQTYSRFPSSILDIVFANPTADSIYNAVMERDNWTQRIQALNLPHGFDIIMGDVCGGSESTSMAKKVLSWRKSENNNADTLWRSLGLINTKIFEKLRVLTSLELNFGEAFRAVLRTVSRLKGADWAAEMRSATFPSPASPASHNMSMTVTGGSHYSNNNNNNISGKYEGAEKIMEVLIEIRSLFKQARAQLKDMGDQAGVGIEPASQTNLVNATEEVPGVLCAGVPGAGGEDAVFALVLSAESRCDVEVMWSKWHTTEDGKKSGAVVCPLLLHAETNKKVSGVRNESLGWASSSSSINNNGQGAGLTPVSTPRITPKTTPKKA